MGFLCFFPEQRWRLHPSTDFNTKWINRRGFAQGRAFSSKNRNFFLTHDPRAVSCYWN